MGKGLPVTLIDKYETMVKDIMKPVLDKIELEKKAFLKLEKINVIKQWGLAEKISRLALFEAEIKQLKEELEGFLGRYGDGGDVHKEAWRRTNENTSFRVFDDAMNAYIKVIRLSSAPQEVKEVFDKLDKDMDDWKRLATKINYSQALEKSADAGLLNKFND